MPRYVSLVLALGLAAAIHGQTAPAPGEDQTEAWEALIATRNVLAHAPRAIPFEQTFVPAGFSTGDRETGVASFDLPDCVRWDYLDPDPRSYLLCGETVLAWNEGEDSGRRLRLRGGESGAFELWLSPIEELKDSYRAKLARDGTSVRIQPLDEAEFVSAEILVDDESGLPLRFEYRDLEGSVTSFLFGQPELLDADDRRFELPPLEWIDEED